MSDASTDDEAVQTLVESLAAITTFKQRTDELRDQLIALDESMVALTEYVKQQITRIPACYISGPISAITVQRDRAVAHARSDHLTAVQSLIDCYLCLEGIRVGFRALELAHAWGGLCTMALGEVSEDMDELTVFFERVAEAVFKFDV